MPFRISHSNPKTSGGAAEQPAGKRTSPRTHAREAGRPASWLVSLVVLAGGAMCAYAGWSAIRTNGQPGFPVDDPWIHLQFARNLLQYGAFSYYKTEMVTSGSTSPLYTILLAGGFLFTQNEFFLSYALGISFFILSGIVLYKIARMTFGGTMWAAAAVLLLLFEPRLEWGALSGMETTFFILAILVTTYFYLAWRPIALGISAGLAVWVRPEALLFIGLLVLDSLYRRAVVARALKSGRPAPGGNPGMRWLGQAGIIALVIVGAYAGFNLKLSGSLFPNTLAAKIAYYSRGGQDYPQQVLAFVTERHLNVLSWFAAAGVLSILWSVVRLRRDDLLLVLLWPGALFLAYWKELPYLYHEGRYLMPILPFIILLGLRGAETCAGFGARLFRNPLRRTLEAGAAGAAALIFGAQFGYASWQMKDTYAEDCSYITQRQVRTAQWIHDHLPPNSVIGTHDVGAIGFYSGEKIVDMVGLVSPEMIESIGSLDKLKQFLVRKGVTHLAVLRNWFEVVNENPLFQTDEERPEIMEVFPFDPLRTHFTTRDAGRMTQAGAYYLSSGSARDAAMLLERSASLDPNSSKTHYWLGRSYVALGDAGKGAAEIREAVRLNPQFWDARETLCELMANSNHPDEAIAALEDLVKDNPDYPRSYGMLAQLYESSRHDSVKALKYREVFVRLTGQVSQ